MTIFTIVTSQLLILHRHYRDITSSLCILKTAVKTKVLKISCVFLSLASVTKEHADQIKIFMT